MSKDISLPPSFKRTHTISTISSTSNNNINSNVNLNNGNITNRFMNISSNQTELKRKIDIAKQKNKDIQDFKEVLHLNDNNSVNINAFPAGRPYASTPTSYNTDDVNSPEFKTPQSSSSTSYKNFGNSPTFNHINNTSPTERSSSPKPIHPSLRRQTTMAFDKRSTFSLQDIGSDKTPPTSLDRPPPNSKKISANGRFSTFISNAAQEIKTGNVNNSILAESFITKNTNASINTQNKKISIDLNNNNVSAMQQNPLTQPIKRTFTPSVIHVNLESPTALSKESSKVSAPDNKNNNSNVSRFWADFANRNPTNSNESANDLNDARKKLQAMHAEIEKQWNKHVEKHEDEFDNLKSKNSNISNPSTSNIPPTNTTNNIPHIPSFNPNHDINSNKNVKSESNTTKTTNDMKFFDISEAKRRLQEMHQDVSNSWNQYEAKQSSTSYTGTKDTPVDPILLKLNKLSMQDLKKLMKKYNVNGDGCIEKDELIEKIRDAYIKHASNAKVVQKEKEAEDKLHQTKQDMQTWAKQRSLFVMLNEINGAEPDSPLFLSNHPAYSPVNRAYKKAMVKIHPDKHMHDPIAHAQANEKFKYLNDAFLKFKKLNDGK